MIKIGSIVGVIILDRLTKFIITHRLRPSQSIHITDFFNITYIQNKGIAFGILNKHSDSISVFLTLMAINIIAIILLVLWLYRSSNNGWITTGISIIIGGAVGNLIDRIRYRGVVDFIDLHIRQYHWPAFNIADTAVTTGTIILGIGLLLIKNKNAS